MSYYIIHILNHGSRLSVDRGCLVLKYPDNTERRAPLSEILTVIVSARGISFSSDSISEIIKNGGIILHCDDNYRPVGKTTGLSKIIYPEILQRQINASKEFCDKLWNILIKAKVENQATVLDIMGIKHELWNILKSETIDEGNTARYYWKHFFSKFGRRAPHERERKDAQNPVNQMLNYAYAVMGATVHRSIIAHGMNSNFGIHHKLRFKADPLLYDLMEPLRPFCDLILFKFKIDNTGKPIKEFIKYVAKNFIEIKLKIDDKNIKIINAIDKYISSVSNCFFINSTNLSFVPKIKDISSK